MQLPVYFSGGRFKSQEYIVCIIYATDAVFKILSFVVSNKIKMKRFFHHCDLYCFSGSWMETCHL